jgi:hypothetical protein
MCYHLIHTRRVGRIAHSVLVVSLLALGCQSGRESGEDMPVKDIKSVMESHVDELMAIPGVTGVAIGELDNGTPCIMVLVVELTDDMSRKLPKSLDGHPVLSVESGEFKPMSGKDG